MERSYILEMIHVNNKVEQRLSMLMGVTTIKAASPADIQHYGTGFKIVCEDLRLSLPFAGKQVHVVDLAKCDTPVETLNFVELEVLLDVCAATLDIEGKVPNGPAEENMRSDFIDYNQTFKKARDTMKALHMSEL